MEEQVDRLNRMIGNLVEASRMDSGKTVLNNDVVDLPDLLATAIESLSLLVSKRNLVVERNIPPTLSPIMGDRDRLLRVFNNILDNALRHTPEGVRVELKTQLIENRIQLSAKDSGEGVSSEEAQHLFDRFYRVDESRARNDGGSGFGLAIAKSIVEVHKGRIWAESEKGKGLKVLIELPRG